ncbi:C-factor [Echria macrotheca]|uniref:C-factor n=1 Tax=Echria macrotheca TaxID=438768 RepID=A0AAJ0B7V9_9PEZI|nr:C-factor [Echria macrotheca]
MPVYCITGTNRGIGLELVRQLSRSPSNTILATTRPSADLTDLHAAASPTTHILPCDTADLSSVRQFAESAAKLLRDPNLRIDYLINNAGLSLSAFGAVGESLHLEPDDVLKQISVNVLGPAKMVEYLMEKDVLADSVRVVNVSSVMGSLSKMGEMQPRRVAGYSISKAALNMLSVHQAGDIRSRLSRAVVVVLDPGWVRTRMGGEWATLSVEECVARSLQLVHGLGGGDNGRFLEYTGMETPW